MIGARAFVRTGPSSVASICSGALTAWEAGSAVDLHSFPGLVRVRRSLEGSANDLAARVETSGLCDLPGVASATYISNTGRHP